MGMILPIMLATSPIWLILGFIAWLIAKDYEELKRYNRRIRNENVEAPKSQYVPVGFRSVGNVDIGEKAEDSNGTVGNTAKWLGR